MLFCEDFGRSHQYGVFIIPDGDIYCGGGYGCLAAANIALEQTVHYRFLTLKNQILRNFVYRAPLCRGGLKAETPEKRSHIYAVKALCQDFCVIVSKQAQPQTEEKHFFKN